MPTAFPRSIGVRPRAVTAVSGRLAQLACAVAVAPFAILTVLFVGTESI